MSDPLFARFGREYQPGDVLFREGESGDVMFVIQSGAVRIAKSVGGDDKILAILGPGEFLGEMAILNGKPRTATATVVVDAAPIDAGDDTPPSVNGASGATIPKAIHWIP